MFLADRYIKGECPNCGAKDQYGDACENCSTVYSATELKNPYSDALGREAGAQVLGALFLQALRRRSARRFLQQWLETPGRLQPQVVNKAKEWLDGEGDKALADWDISRDPPYFGIRIPGHRRGKYLYVWLDAPIGYLASFKNYCAKKGIDFEEFLHDPKTEQIHFIGKDIIYFHTLFWPAMLEVRGQAVQGARPRLRAWLHRPCRARRCPSRAAPASTRCATCDLGHESGMAALLHRRQAQRATSRTSTSTPTTSSRASTATWSASTSTSPAARGVHQPEVRRQACYAAGRRASICAVEGCGEIAEAYEAREFGKALREVMALADLVNQFVDAAQAVGAGEGRREASGAPARSARPRSSCSAC